MLKFFALRLKNGKIVGRYNGQQIVGFRVQFIVRWNVWDWLPRWDLMFSWFVAWLCFRVRWEYEYGSYVE